MKAIDASVANTSQAMNTVLEAQKQSRIEDGAASLKVHIDRIDRSISQLIRYQDKLAEAMSSDFGHRSVQHSKMMDVAGMTGMRPPSTKYLRRPSRKC